MLTYRRLKQGKFSVSSRIAAFLSTVNALDVDIVHKSGKDIQLTDYVSRHPPECEGKRCQVCDYVKEQVFIGEAIINRINAADILDGRYQMLYVQPSAWSSLQRKDRVLSQLTKLVEIGQKPEAKKTGVKTLP